MASGRQQPSQQTQPPTSSATASAAPPAPQQQRTATPTLAHSDWAIGHKLCDRTCANDNSLQITTTTGQVHSGTLLIHDQASQIVVLSSQSRSSSSNGADSPTPLVDLQIVKISSIKDIRVLGGKVEGFKPYEAKPITIQDAKWREELARKRASEEERRIGVGVTPEGQKIYDAFAKTLPVKWVDKSILVAEQSLINPPYTPESVVSASAALNGTTEDNARSAMVERVKHVLQKERDRLGIGATSKGPAEGVRKGG